MALDELRPCNSVLYSALRPEISNNPCDCPSVKFNAKFQKLILESGGISGIVKSI
jgi:hypothetical protein